MSTTKKLDRYLQQLISFFVLIFLYSSWCVKILKIMNCKEAFTRPNASFTYLTRAACIMHLSFFL